MEFSPFGFLHHLSIEKVDGALPFRVSYYGNDTTKEVIQGTAVWAAGFVVLATVVAALTGGSQ